MRLQPILTNTTDYAMDEERSEILAMAKAQLESLMEKCGSRPRADKEATALEVDGIVVTLVTAGDALSVSAEIGEPSSEGRAVFAELMLEANLQSGAFFAKEPESGAYVLVRRLQLPALDAESFDTALEELVNLAETWRRLLADFRPIAKAAAERTDGAPQFGANGFVQV